MASFSRKLFIILITTELNQIVHSRGTRTEMPLLFPTDDHYTFDLSQNPDKCVEHSLSYDEDDHKLQSNQQTRSQRILNNPLFKTHLTFILPKNSNCFKIFELYECNQHEYEMGGAYLQFLNIEGNSKILKLNSGGQNSQHERLLNFEVYPNSFKICNEQDDKKMDLKREHCQSRFWLQITGTYRQGLDIDKDCIPTPKSPNDPPPARSEAKFLIIRDDPNDQGTICLELFSQNNCFGEIVRLVIPPNSKLWNNWNNKKAALIWEYFSDSMGNPVVDIDIKSVRKCSYCLEKNTDNDDNIVLTNFSGFPSKNKTKTPEKAPEDNPENGLFSANHQKCYQNCTQVSSLMTNSSVLSSNKNCFYYFDVSNCSMAPIFRDSQNVNLTDVHLVQKTNPHFMKWAIAKCKDDHEDEHCSTLNKKTPTKKFQDHFYGIDETPKPNQNGQTQPAHVENIVLSIAGGLAILMLILVIIMSVLLWRKKRRIQEIRARCIPRGVAQSQRTDANQVNNYVNDITGLKALCESFSNGYEIPRDHIYVGSMSDSTATIIGVGEFSVAFKGLLEPNGRIVAVKTLKSGYATTRVMKGALKEAQIFMQLGKHPAILEFLGVCTENVRKGEVFTVMAWCEHGTLKGFLAHEKSHFESLVEDGDWVDDEKMQVALDFKTTIEKGPPVKFNTIHLFKWCVQIADAMEFLAVRMIVHVSLSARNVLLDDKFLCKISDFHMAKSSGDVIPDGGFSTMNRVILNKERLVPWRYYAVESLLDDVFTTQSDVWTFGIFMWEVFSLGATPYPEYTYGPEFTLCIKHGYRLQSPNFTTIECYQLMLTCWYDAPEKRPSFTKLKAKLYDMTPKKNVPITPGPFQIVRTLSKS